MKNITTTVLAIATTTFLFTACGDEDPTIDDMNNGTDTTAVVMEDPEPNVEEVTVPALPDVYVDVDLNESGYAGMMKGPEDAIITTSPRFTNDGEIQQISIQKAEGQPRLLMFESSNNLDAAKANIKANTRNVFEHYLVEDNDGVLYYAKSNTDNADVYNFIRVMEKDGKNWHIVGEASNSLEPLTKEQALELYAMAKSVN